MRCFFLSLLLLPALQSQAQLYISATGNVGSHRSRDWRSFSESYLAQTGSQLVKAKMKLGACSGYAFGIDAIAPHTDYWEGFSGMYFGFRMGKRSSRADAEFTNGSRHFEMRENYWYCPVGFGVSESGGFFTGSLGIGMSNAQLISMFEYPDGTQSIGRERFLNGVYSGSSFLAIPGIMGGVGGGKNDLKIYLTAEISWQIAFGGNPLEEKMYTNGAFVDFSADSEYEQLPRDYQAFQQNPPGYDFTNKENLVRANLGGINCALGIKISFF